MKKTCILALTSFLVLILSSCGIVAAAQLSSELSNLDALDEYHMETTAITKIYDGSALLSSETAVSEFTIGFDPFYILMDDGSTKTYIEEAVGSEGEDAYAIYTFQDEDELALDYTCVWFEIWDYIPQKYNIDIDNIQANNTFAGTVKKQGNGYLVESDLNQLFNESQMQEFTKTASNAGVKLDDENSNATVYYEFLEDQINMNIEANILMGKYSIKMSTKSVITTDDYETIDIHSSDFRIYSDHFTFDDAISLTNAYKPVYNTLTYRYSYDYYKVYLEPGYYAMTCDISKGYYSGAVFDFYNSDRVVIHPELSDYKVEASVYPQQSNIFQITSSGFYYLGINNQGMITYNFTINPISSVAAYLSE